MSIEADIRDDIVDYLRKHSRIDDGPFPMETSFDEAGVDSLDLLAIAEIIEKKYGLSLTDERIAGVHSFADFLSFASEKTVET
jgi:acyl carrier protein